MISKISVKDIKVGDVIYSDYTKAKYIVTHLPRLINGEDCYAMVRTDGKGYCYLQKSLRELQRDIYYSGENHYLFTKDMELFGVEGC